MTAGDALLLRKSFKRVEAQGHVAALAFYRRLFELDPKLRPLFKTEIEAQAQKLMEMLSFALAQLERPEELRVSLEALGARHVGYGVEEQHYATVAQALLDMLAAVLGPGFTPELRAAWTSLLGYIAKTMLHGAATVQKAGAAR